jgi:predicted lipoprotein with Yx(FWY)xxD motif
VQIRRLARSPAALTLILVLAIGCAEEDTPAPAQGGDADVLVSGSDLGDILTDGDGNTLYVFLQDTDGTSACTGDCATTWPPLAATGAPTAGDGVEAEIGTSERDDGTQQVTVGGAPAYLYAGDAVAGDTNGQGMGDVWFAVAPSGEPVTGAAGNQTSPPGGGYGYDRYGSDSMDG